MDQQRTQRSERSERRLLDLDDAPGLDPSEESALDAIRRQLDEEFARAEGIVEVDATPEPRGATEAEPDGGEWTRPRAERHELIEPETRPRIELETRPRRPADGARRMRGLSERPERPRSTPDDERVARAARERWATTWARPERLRDERPAPVPPPRNVREPADSFPVRRIPPSWRPVEPPEPDPPTSRPGVFLSIGLVAGLAGGAAGALLTVLLVTGTSFDDMQQSWARVVGAARDSGLADLAAKVTDRVSPPDARDREPRASVDRSGPPPASTPRRGPVTTAEISEATESGTPRAESAASIELRGLISAGRDAYVRRDYAMAERLFAQAVERSTADGLLRYHHAIALMGLGRFSEARSQFQSALRLGVDGVVADEARRALAQIDTRRRRR